MSRFFLLPVIVVGAAFLSTGCSNSKKRAEEKQRALEQAREAKKNAEAEAGKPAEAGPPPKVQLEPFWEAASATWIKPDSLCPEGFWALFPGEAPGDTPEEKKKNAARRGELVAQARAATYAVKLRAPSQVKLQEFNAPKGHFPLEVDGSIDCNDTIGRITVAWTAAKAIDPGNSAGKDGAEVSQNIWQAPPLQYTLPFSTSAEAKSFSAAHRFDLDTRVLFKLGAAKVDKKMFKTTKVQDGEVTIGGANEDWGAGRMVQTSILGVRVATDREKTQLIEKR
jgi:hypothetical protein